MGSRSVRNSKWPPTGRFRGGGFYTTLDRMERKGYLTWVSEVPENARRKDRQRQFSVTTEGLAALKSSRRALITLWDGLEPMLED